MGYKTKHVTTVIEGHRVDILRVGEGMRCEILLMDKADTKVIKQIFASDIISAFNSINACLSKLPKPA